MDAPWAVTVAFWACFWAWVLRSVWVAACKADLRARHGHEPDFNPYRY